MTKHREFMVSEDGVHLMHGEFTLCGDAFDIGDTENEPDAPTMKATEHLPLTAQDARQREAGPGTQPGEPGPRGSKRRRTQLAAPHRDGTPNPGM